jgi:hypothetical protein
VVTSIPAFNRGQNLAISTQTPAAGAAVPPGAPIDIMIYIYIGV